MTTAREVQRLQSIDTEEMTILLALLISCSEKLARECVDSTPARSTIARVIACIALIRERT